MTPISLTMWYRSFRSRLWASDKAGGDFRGIGKPAARLKNRSGRTAGCFGGTAFPNQRTACDQKQACEKSLESVSLHRRRHYCRICSDLNSCNRLYLFARPIRHNRQLAVYWVDRGKGMRIGRFYLCGTGISCAATASPELFGRKIYGIISQ